MAGLKREQIEAFVTREAGNTVVRVQEIDLRGVLALPLIRRRPERVESPFEGPSPACPECDSEDVQPTPRMAIFALGVVSLIGLSAAIGVESLAVALLLPSLAFSAFLLDTRKCGACGGSWTPEVEEPREGDARSEGDGVEIDYLPPPARERTH